MAERTSGRIEPWLNPREPVSFAETYVRDARPRRGNSEEEGARTYILTLLRSRFLEFRRLRDIEAGLSSLTKLVEQMETGLFVPSANALTMADQALKRLAAREGEDIDDWAERITKGI